MDTQSAINKAVDESIRCDKIGRAELPEGITFSAAREAIAHAAAQHGCEFGFARENDGSYDVWAYEDDADEGKSVWRINVQETAA